MEVVVRFADGDVCRPACLDRRRWWVLKHVEVAGFWLAGEECCEAAGAADDKVGVSDAGNHYANFAKFHSKRDQSHPQHWIGFVCAESDAELGAGEHEVEAAVAGGGDGSQGRRARFNPIVAVRSKLLGSCLRCALLRRCIRKRLIVR